MKPREREREERRGRSRGPSIFAVEELTAKSRSRSTRWPTARW
jgi:hypothetical protein